MADFIFRVDSVQLTDAQQDKIAAAIQGAVLTELARLDLHGDKANIKKALPTGGSPEGGTFLYTPIRWHGGLLLKAADVAAAVATKLSVINTDERSQTAA
jgi:hypothetical protein